MRKALFGSGAVLALALAGIVLFARDEKPSPPGRAQIVAAGRIEPVSEEIQIGADAPGRIRELLVEEGDRVTRGQILATLENDDRRARVAHAEAMAALALDAKRRRESVDDVSREEADRAAREHDAASATLDEARAQLEKTIVRSPVDGVVIRRHGRRGESVATAPIYTVADVSKLRVRASVDEHDVAKLREGLRVYVTAEAYGSRRFAGRVARVGLSLGPKAFRTHDPTEKLDTKVLEVLIDLEDRDLPLNLRVDAYFDTES